jgi:hypothetical protein
MSHCHLLYLCFEACPISSPQQSILFDCPENKIKINSWCQGSQPVFWVKIKKTQETTKKEKMKRWGEGGGGQSKISKM